MSEKTNVVLWEHYSQERLKEMWFELADRQPIQGHVVFVKTIKNNILKTLLTEEIWDKFKINQIE